MSSKYRFLSDWDITDNSNPPPVQVVTIFLQMGDKFLVLQRAKNDMQYGLWGIPGGKLEFGEQPLSGLIREVKEETGISLNPTSCTLLGAALSTTVCDGKYGLYLYHCRIHEETEIIINRDEHHNFSWVTLEEFTKLNLLFAQLEAYCHIEHYLKKIVHLNKGNYYES